MRAGSLFSGIGGLDLGVSAALGAEPAWFCEADKHCHTVLERHWPGVPILEDVRSIVAKLTQEQIQEAVRLYDDGLSCGVVADRMGVSRQSMWKVLRRRTEMRPREKYGADNVFYRGGWRSSDRAQNKMEKAIERGELVRPDTCENCGKRPGQGKDGRSLIQGHHDDYNRPLDVRWLCQPCHHEWHKQHTPVEEVVSSVVPDIEIDVLHGGYPLAVPAVLPCGGEEG